MGLKIKKGITPGLRNSVNIDFDSLDKVKPLASKLSKRELKALGEIIQEELQSVTGVVVQKRVIE